MNWIETWIEAQIDVKIGVGSFSRIVFDIERVEVARHSQSYT